MIKQLSEQTAEQLCAQQVITSLPDCIKQLIDNSIDAKATYIKIVLHEYGKVKVEVIDNGMGIDNFDFLGKKGTTSKNKMNERFDYLGFRGQAVHSIGRVSGDMQIESKCIRDGHRRKFNVVTSAYEQTKQQRLCHGQFNFQIPNRQGSRNTGTKVTIQNIFKRLPVRQIELSCKCKQFLRRTNDLIKEYCLIYPQIQFIFINTREGKEELIIQTVAQKRYDRAAWLERIKELDDRIGQSLVYISTNLFEGFVLDKIQSGSSKQNKFIKKNYHYIFLNRRPIDPIPLIVGALNQIYKKYNNSTKYAFMINLKLDHNEIDVNLTPNKREVFIRKNTLEAIIQSLKKQITAKVVEEITVLNSPQDAKNGPAKKGEPSVLAQMSKYNPQNSKNTIFFPPKSQEMVQNKSREMNRSQKLHQNTQIQQKYPMSRPEEHRSQQLQKSSKLNVDMSELPKISIDRNKLKQQLNNKLGVSFLGLRRTTDNPFLNNKQAQLTEQQEKIIKIPHEQKLRQEQQDAKRRAEFMEQIKQVKIQQNQQELNKVKMSNASKSHSHHQKGNLVEQQLSKRKQYDQFQRQSEHQVPASEAKEHEKGRSSWIATMPRGLHDVQLQNRIKSKLNIDMSKIFTKFNQSKQPPIIKHNQHTDPNLQLANNTQEDNKQIRYNSHKQKDDEQINEELCGQLGELAPKSVKKHHFQYFELIGQFNKGFIITTFNRRFYMVDQHAADQKFQYQKNLLKATDMQCINCFDQKEITPIECDQIEQAKILLGEAGFFYTIADRKLLKLERCPVFKGRKLGMEYFNLIVSQKKELTKVDKFVAMCAMNACRQATKVGEALTRQEMKREVVNLSGLASPWNCPHGRPTLIDLGGVQKLRNAIKVQKQYMI